MRCPTCPARYRFVPPEGPCPAAVCLIGEGPAKHENALERPFVGDAGQELDNHYLPCANLLRPQVYVTNASKCPMPGFRTPKPEEVWECARTFLPDELDAVRPEVVVLMGASACSLVPEIDLETHHGTPRTATLYGKSYTVFPTYHPAAGLHKTAMMTFIEMDFQALGRFLRGNRAVAAPRESTVIPVVLNSRMDVRRAFGSETGQDALAVDTESDGPDPFCLTFSFGGDMGYWISAGNTEALNEFWAYVASNLWMVIFHHSLHDLGVCRKMGGEPQRIDDTVIRAALRGNLPLGLKSLAFRLLGVEMRSYDDVVVPYSKAAAVDWLLNALSLDLPAPAQRVVDGAKGYRLHTELGVRKRIERIIADSVKVGVDVWDRWELVPERMREWVEGKLGPLPRKSIRHVPEAEAVRYAVDDAVKTMAVWRALQWQKTN